jgi:hypothetical protein
LAAFEFFSHLQILQEPAIVAVATMPQVSSLREMFQPGKLAAIGQTTPAATV